MAVAKLSGGPLDGQVLPLDDEKQGILILPFGDGQLHYEREGRAEHTGAHDGATTVPFVFVSGGVVESDD